MSPLREDLLREAESLYTGNGTFSDGPRVDQLLEMIERLDAAAATTSPDTDDTRPSAAGSPVARPLTLDARRDDLVARAAALSFRPVPVFDGAALAASEFGWQAAAQRASEAGVTELERLLEREEAAARRRRDIEACWAADDARRAQMREPLADDDPELMDLRERAAEAERIATHRASTEGRLEAVEGLLVEIRDLLARRDTR